MYVHVSLWQIENVGSGTVTVFRRGYPCCRRKRKDQTKSYPHLNAHALPVLLRRMGSSTTAKRRPRQQPQSKEENKKLPDTAAGNKRQRGRGGIATQQQPRRMENVSTAAAVSFVIILMVALVLAVRNIVFGGGGDVAVLPTLVRPTPAPVVPAVDEPSLPLYTSMGTYELLKTIPHDTSAFTQGLVTIQDQEGNLRLYEGTGMYGDSELRILDLNGTVLERHILPSKYFGEGIVHFPLLPEEETATASYGMLQLTWRETTMFEYRIALNEVVLAPPIANTSFTSTNNNEGWGITYDPTEQVFYMTDGSAYVHVWDRTMRQEVRKFAVTYQYPRNDAPIRLVYLNELEWDPSTQTILANVLGQDVIVRIDPTTGFCATIYDFGSIFPASTRPRGTDVFNGIALSYDLHRQGSTGNQPIDPQHYWVTGKYWPSMYYVKLIDGIN
jgi:glutaminyl-peptide cyclotransferase